MLIIRTAELEDVMEIGRIHVDTWRAAYRGMLPRAFLDKMTVEERATAWARRLKRNTPGQATLVSEDHDQSIVGFASCGPLRHLDPRYGGEIEALYVNRSHQREGHGRRLFLAAANRLAMHGLNGLFVWVLADNHPARAFYEALGGQRTAEATRLFAGKTLREVGYGWAVTPHYGERQKTEAPYGRSDSLGNASSRLSSSR